MLHILRWDLSVRFLLCLFQQHHLVLVNSFQNGQIQKNSYVLLHCHLYIHKILVYQAFIFIKIMHLRVCYITDIPGKRQIHMLPHWKLKGNSSTLPLCLPPSFAGHLMMDLTENTKWSWTASDSLSDPSPFGNIYILFLWSESFNWLSDADQ